MPARSQHEHALSALEPRFGVERHKGTAIGKRERRSLKHGEAFRDADAGRAGGHHTLCEAAPGDKGNDGAANCVAAHTGATGHDTARHLEARREGQLGARPAFTGDGREVGQLEAHGFHANEHFARSRLRLLRLFQDQALRSREAMNTIGFHEISVEPCRAELNSVIRRGTSPRALRAPSSPRATRLSKLGPAAPVSSPPAPARPSERAARVGAAESVGAAEWLYLASVVAFWAIFVISRGEDRAWDFRNYHWYIPYAFLHGRMAIDVAVAHQATFYNPFLDIPFYWLATHTRSWIALGILGAVQGANVIPLYFIARSILRVEHRVLASAILSLLCMTGSLTLYLAGTTYYDNVMSVFVLAGLAIVITNRDRLREGSLWLGAAVAFAAGLLVGSAVGLKLPEAPFALGFAAVLLVLSGDWKHRTSRLLGGGLGGVAGVALFAGFWFVTMGHLTGNPLFPYFNQFFHSPLALTASYRDMRFIPTHLKTELLFPLLFSIDWGVADDLPFHDIRVMAGSSPATGTRAACGAGCRLGASGLRCRELHRVAQSVRHLSLHPSA
jgi:hypothetical protein